MTQQANNLGEPVNVRLDTDQKQALEQLAQENDRTFAAEVRRAVRIYLKTEGKK